MTSSPKSFTLRFIFYFSLTLILLGIGQTFFGTLRLYNPSEQEYERLSPEKATVPVVNTTLPEETTSFLSNKTLPEEAPETQSYYVAENKTPTVITQTATQTPPTLTPQTVRSEKKNKNTIKSPVEVSVSPEEDTPPTGYNSTIQTVINGRYFQDALWKFPIIIDMERVEPRGQMYNESITLGSGMTNLPEVSKVLVHEIGHMIDIYTFRKGIRKADLSDDFYAISWKDATTIKAGISQTSFVSGYAATNQYEDFAESFTFYVFHNQEFQKRAEKNEHLKQKYTFLKTNVFGSTFTGSSYEKNTIPKKIWDTTKIALKGNTIDTIFAWVQTAASYKS